MRKHMLWLAILIVAVGLLGSAASAHDPESAAPLSTETDRPQYRGLNAYYGELHQHTGYSPDGCGLPMVAIQTARSRQNDFMSFTDHHNSFYYPEIGSVQRGCRLPDLDYQKWETLKELADTYNRDGSFVLMRGYEHTRELGHLNVHNSSHYTSPVEQDDFYAWLATQPYDVYAQFNHPMAFTWGGMGDFDGFLYFPPADPKITLFEMAVKPAFNEFLQPCLDRGWRVSCVGYGDGHDADLAGTRRYGIFAEDTTRATLNDALRAGRTFGNTDGYLAAALVANDLWMGSAVCTDTVHIVGFAQDRDGDEIAIMELLGPHGVVATHAPNSNPAEHDFGAVPIAPGEYLYLHVVDANGDHAWSGTFVRPLVPRLWTNPATARFELDAGGAPAVEGGDTAVVALEANDGASLPWQIDDVAEWVHVVPTSGLTLPAMLSVTVDSQALDPGLHVSGMRVTAPGSEHVGTVLGVQVQRDSTTRPDATLAPRILDLSTIVTDPTISTTLTLDLTPEGAPWFASVTVPWLALPQWQGDGDGSLHVIGDLAGLPTGTHVGHVVVNAGSMIRVCEVRCHLQPVDTESMVLQEGFAGYEGVSDTYIDAWKPTESFGESNVLNVRSAGNQVSLLRYDLGHIPTSSLVFSATLSVYAELKTTGSSLLLSVHEMLAPWNEDEATWERASEGIPWDVPGARGPADMGGETISSLGAPDAPQWYTLDVSPLAQKWVSDPDANHGVAILGDSGTSLYFSFTSSDSAVQHADHRPKLSIAYGQPLPTMTPTPSRTPPPTATPTCTITASPTHTSTATTTPTTTETASPSATATPTSTITPSTTTWATATQTSTPEPTRTPSGDGYLPLVVYR